MLRFWFHLRQSESFTANDSKHTAERIRSVNDPGGIRQRQKPQAPTPQAPVRNRQTRKVANAKVRIG